MDSLYAFKCKRFLTLSTQQHFKYYCEALFETLYITSGSRIYRNYSR
jgi:hypothetical protein